MTPVELATSLLRSDVSAGIRRAAQMVIGADLDLTLRSEFERWREIPQPRQRYQLIDRIDRRDEVAPLRERYLQAVAELCVALKEVAE